MQYPIKFYYILSKWLAPNTCIVHIVSSILKRCIVLSKMPLLYFSQILCSTNDHWWEFNSSKDRLVQIVNSRQFWKSISILTRNAWAYLRSWLCAFTEILKVFLNCSDAESIDKVWICALSHVQLYLNLCAA